MDWFACGGPRAGRAADVPWAGDLAGEAPTCALDEHVGDVADRLRSGPYDFCVVVHGEERAVLGLLRGDALLKDEDARVEEVMELGPKTTRPSEPLEELLRARESVGVKHFLVATSRGAFMGVFDRDEAERAVEARKGRPSTSTDMENSST
jgi:CBS domain-containing protein